MKSILFLLTILMALNAGAQYHDKFNHRSEWGSQWYLKNGTRYILYTEQVLDSIMKDPNFKSGGGMYAICSVCGEYYALDFVEKKKVYQCHHIYVAVMDSVVTINTGGSSCIGTVFNPAKQIVCILCHKVTNQVIKYEPQAVMMPCRGCGITLDSLENPRPKIGETVKILLTDKN